VTRVTLGLLLSRTASQMAALAVVLFVLVRYHSPTLAGFAVFAATAPGVVVSPLAGALLDRHGRKWLIVLDQVVAGVALFLVGALALGNLLPPALLLAIIFAQALTYPLSTAGARSLYPLIVPRQLWDRVNAVDSALYVVATLIGPPLAGGLVAAFGGPVAIVVLGFLFAVSAVVMFGIRDPETDVMTTGSLIGDALAGLRYVATNPSLRGLALCISIFNAAGGIFSVAIPVLVFQRLHGGPALVGALWAVLGAAGIISGFAFGRIGSEGRERALLAGGLATGAVATIFLAFAFNLPVFALAMVLLGVANGPTDIALFSLRQRRTDPAWLGRAFAVSMALNIVGIPVGAALAGPLIAVSTMAAMGAAVLFSVVSTVMPLTIPKDG
jgi:MFS family permease